MPAFNSVGIRFFIVVLQVGHMALVYPIAQTVAELQLRYQLEEWQIQVASQSHLNHQVSAF